MGPATIPPAPSPIPLYRAAEARAADRWTIDQLGVPGIVLMEHAGRAVAERALAFGKRRVVVLCGPGNNGGDGWVAARHLLTWRAVEVVVVGLRAPAALSGDAGLAAALYEKTAAAAGMAPPLVLERADALANVLETSPEQTLIVDALFGTGLGRPLEGLAADVVERVRRAGLSVLAVDLPSGLPSDGEAPRGPVLEATQTVTFGGFKVAHFAEPGSLWCGEVLCADITIEPDPEQGPRHVLVGHAPVRRAGFTLVEPRLPGVALPGPSAHKGRFGHVLVLEGAARTRGAAQLAARAALRAGAGLCTLLVGDLTRDDVGRAPEVMRRKLSAGEEPPLDSVDAVVVGPGLGNDPDARARARAVLEAAALRSIPAVVDAEALPLLVDPPPALRAVATPHPGEAARLLGSSSATVQASRVVALEELRGIGQGQVVWLLKGACPLVALPGGGVAHVLGNHPALAVAGSGDVLAGTVGALLAMGCSLEDAAVFGAAAHQAAGRLVAESRPRGALAGEIADHLPQALAEAWAR